MLKHRLKELRKEKSISQRDLANALKLSPSTIAMYEVGQREPDNEILNRIADYFNVTTDYLLGRTDEKNKPGGLLMSVGFGKRLREMREKKGLTQAELAKIASLGESTISFYESGKREPNYEVLVALADILDTTPNYLITGKNEWWEKDKPPTDIELEEFVKNSANIKLMGNPLDEKAKDDVLMFLRAAHELIKEKRKSER